MYKIEYYPEVKDDLLNLPDTILKEVIDYFEKYKIDPFSHSQKLYNQGGINLLGYRKTYLANATYRIILSVEKGVTKVVEVVAVGKREDKQVYFDAALRITQK